jgi:integrase
MLMEAHPCIKRKQFADVAAGWITKESPGWSTSTINRRLASFNAFARWAGVPDLLGYRRPQRSEDVTRMRCTVTDVQRVLRSTREFAPYALGMLCGLAGLRIGEAVGTTWEQIDPSDSDQTMAFVAVHGKGSKERVVPILRSHVDSAARLWTGEQAGRLFDLDVDQGRYIVRKTFKEHGLEVESHDLRRAFAKAAYDVNHDIRAVQKLLGHSDVTTTMRYIGSPMEERVAIVKGIA